MCLMFGSHNSTCGFFFFFPSRPQGWTAAPGRGSQCFSILPTEPSCRLLPFIHSATHLLEMLNGSLVRDRKKNFKSHILKLKSTDLVKLLSFSYLSLPVFS